MRRCIVLLITFLLSFQVQAFSAADIVGEWEWLGDSIGRSANPELAIKKNGSHILFFSHKTEPKARYHEETNQICSGCDGNYALISIQNNQPKFTYGGVWNLSSDLLVVKRTATFQESSALKAEAQRVTYDEDKKILVLGSLMSNVNQGKFSYYRKRPDSTASLSPYYANIKDKVINDIDISKIKLGMSPRSVISHLNEEFTIKDVVHFDKYNRLIPYVAKITAVRENDTKVDSYIFEFAKPPYVNRLLSIHRSQQFIFKDNMEDKPPTMDYVKDILIKKYGNAKVVTKTAREAEGKENGIMISWFSKPESCSRQFKPGSKTPACPLLFDAKLSGFSVRHKQYPGIATLLELHLTNFPAIVQNGEAIYQQDKMHEGPKGKLKPHKQKTLEFEL